MTFPRTSPLDGGRLRRRVMAGEPTFGTFPGTASPVVAEVCAAAGADWLLLDLEHGSGGEEQVRPGSRAAAPSAGFWPPSGGMTRTTSSPPQCPDC